eukprot:g13202.t1
MNTASFVLIAAILAAPATAVEYTVSTCADLADVDDTLATGLTIDSATFSCDEYTRFRVRNTMTLKATVPAVEFSNFSLKVLGELTVEPDVTFTGVVEQVANGGVLYVDEGSTATFMGTAYFLGNSVANEQLGPVSCGEGCTRTARGESYITKKGGAVHNKGMLTFESDVIFESNEVTTEEAEEVGRGGAISNTGSGTIMFKGSLSMENNNADGFFNGDGGAIYNRGDIVVDGESSFVTNRAADGGAIHQTGIGSMTFNGMATFINNDARDYRGGAIYNEGVMNFNAGSVFDTNNAYGSGDGGDGGAIYNTDGGEITLDGPNKFEGNNGYRGGAIFNDDEPVATITFPDDTLFIDNTADECPNFYDGDYDNCPVVCDSVEDCVSF